jgi:hypothetical protein
MIISAVKSLGVRNLIIFSVSDGNRTCISLTIAGQNEEIKGFKLDFF